MSQLPYMPKFEIIDEIEGDDEPSMAPQIDAPFGPPIALN